jgi:transcription elongation factor Elf1
MKEYSLDRALSLPPMGCPRCAVVDSSFVTLRSGPHAAAARCQYCGRHLRWLSTHLTHTPSSSLILRQQEGR